MIRITVAAILLAIAAQANAQTNVRFTHEWRFEGHVAKYDDTPSAKLISNYLGELRHLLWFRKEKG